MKGYLQRMVDSVARPERTVHPLVGGMFLKDRQDGVVEESAPVSLRDDRRIDGDLRVRQEPKEIEAPERLAVRPLESGDRDAREDARMTTSKRRMEDDGGIASRMQERHLQTEAGEERQAISGLRVHTLLMPEGIEVNGQQETRQTLIDAKEKGVDAGSNRGVRTEMERAAMKRQESQRGSEDIQIHIGRIEVIAVPPPVQRPAPAVTRKSESLEEYLRRRDRRAR